jgi:bifunctional DNA-binding transcriptional regulator/antitoxin component of YhaV-PrlF toxin-antitoxin module
LNDDHPHRKPILPSTIGELSLAVSAAARQLAPPAARTGWLSARRERPIRAFGFGPDVVAEAQGHANNGRCGRSEADRAFALRSGSIVKQMSKLSSKHQVTIPVSILREAGLAAGDEVVIRASGHGRIEIERADDLVRRFAGSLPAGTYPDGYLDELRGEWRE